MNWKHFNIERPLHIESFVSAFEEDFKPGFVFKGESHNFWEMFYVEEGTVCISADDRVLNLGRNQIIFHKPMELHKFHIEENSYAKAFVMSFSLTSKHSADLEKCALTLSSQQKAFLDNIIAFVRQNSPAGTPSEQSLFYNIHGNMLTIQQLACMTEVFLLSLIENKNPVPTISDSSEITIFKSCIRLMEQNICDWITVPELAKKCNISVSYLKKIFSKYAGFGIHKYFLKTKINFASQLLKQGKTVGEVAAMLSFSSQNYFSIVFKRETGISPLAFKTENNTKA